MRVIPNDTDGHILFMLLGEGALGLRHEGGWHQYNAPGTLFVVVDADKFVEATVEGPRDDDWTLSSMTYTAVPKFAVATYYLGTLDIEAVLPGDSTRYFRSYDGGLAKETMKLDKLPQVGISFPEEGP